LNDDFIDFLVLLAKYNVEFMVIGGHAYVLHVQSRYTKDLDVWVRPTPENLERLRLVSLAFANVDFSVTDALTLLATNKLGFPLVGLAPNLIEVLLRIKAVDFEPAYARAVRVQLREAQIPFIHPHDQIRNKRAAGRPRDLADAADLVRLHGEPNNESLD
jgi:hypothetical protein